MGAKKLSTIDLQQLPFYHFRTETESQDQFLQEVEDNDIIIATGSAGTGKTFVSIVRALKSLFDQEHQKVVIVKPTVGSGGEDIGFLAGSANDKIFPFHYSTIFTLDELIGKEKRLELMKADDIQLMPITFLRGVTFKDTFIIIDEAQNLSVEQMKLIITRIGKGIKMIFLGDEKQSDLKSGKGGALGDAMTRFEGIEGLSLFEFSGSQIVRHEIIEKVLERYD